MRSPRRHRTLAIAAGVVVVLVVAVGAFAATFDWNWFKSPITRYLSAKIGRPVEIRGPLSGTLALSPLITASDVTIGNAPWATDPLLARVARLSVRVDLRSLGGTLEIPELAVQDASVWLERNAEGKANWDFGNDSRSPALGRLDVKDGALRFRDATRGIDVEARIGSAAASGDGQLVIRFEGHGVWEKNDFRASGTATTPFAAAVRQRPYRLDLEARSAGTTGTFKGTFVPSAETLDGALILAGSDLSHIDAFLPFEFSRTPPYRLNANLKYDKGVWSLSELSARVGRTDLAGSFSVVRQPARTAVDADLTSSTSHYTDLRALVGFSGEAADEPQTKRKAAKRSSDKRGAKAQAAATEEKRDAKTEAAATQADKRDAKANATATEADNTGTTTAFAQSQAARATGSGDLSRLKLVDAKITLKARRFFIGTWRFDDFHGRADVKGGVLKLQPTEGTLAGGRMTGTLTVDAREMPARASADLTAHDVELAQLFPALRKRGAAGKASGRGHLSAVGRTARELVEATKGQVAVLSSGGTAESYSAGLSQLDLGQASKLLFRGEATAPIHCAAADMRVEQGVMNVKTLVVDTEAETISGDGRIDLVHKRYDLELHSQSKKPSLFAYKGPVLVEGPFGHPNVHAKSGPLLARVGAAVGLAVVNPLAALLPLVDVGGSAGVSCRALIDRTGAKLNRIEARQGSGPPAADRNPEHSGELNRPRTPDEAANSPTHHAEAPRQPQ